MITREQALALLHTNMESQNLRRHCYAVEATMRALARYLKEDEEKWGIVGLLHDGDYEKTKEYVTEGPVRHHGEKWDLELLTLNYEGQEIDIGGAETTKITKKDSAGNDTDEWLTLSTDFSKSVMMDFEGMQLPIEPKESLAAYKRHLNGEHQKQDIEALEK